MVSQLQSYCWFEELCRGGRPGHCSWCLAGKAAHKGFARLHACGAFDSALPLLVKGSKLLSVDLRDTVAVVSGCRTMLNRYRFCLNSIARLGRLVLRRIYESPVLCDSQ
jgi:hypothetical protein